MFGWFKRRKGLDEGYLGLRGMALNLDPKDLDLPPGEHPSAFGVLMEIGYPKGSATLVVLGNVTTSLYFSGGGGILVGGGHEPVRTTSAKLMKLAQETAASATAETETPLPEPGQVRSIFLTSQGRKALAATEVELGNGRHALSPLFFAAHDVITKLRKLSP